MGFFLPPIPPHLIPSSCGGADLGLFTCYTEAKSMYFSLPNKLFEYIWGEIPIIAEDIPAVRPYIEDFNIGTLIKSEETNTIVEAFNSYLDSQKLSVQRRNILSLKQKLSKENHNHIAYQRIYKT